MSGLQRPVELQLCWLSDLRQPLQLLYLSFLIWKMGMLLDNDSMYLMGVEGRVNEVIQLTKLRTVPMS